MSRSSDNHSQVSGQVVSVRIGSTSNADFRLRRHVALASVASPAKNESYQYDANGNTTTVSSTPTYTYDSFNRLSNAGGMTYYVNPEGQRLRKAGAAGATYFAPDASNALLAENPGSGWIDYVWLNGRLIGRVAGGQQYAIHDDQTGRPEAVTNSSQAVVWRAQNFAFTQNVTTAGIALNLGFPGQYFDAETGLWNNGYRDYQSKFGRYLESDPIGLMGGINTYAYVGDSPLSGIDPFGLCDDQKDTKNLPAVTVIANTEDDASIPTGPLPPPLWLLPSSSPVRKFIDDLLSKQLVKKLSHNALKINEFDKLEPTPFGFGVGLMLYSSPLGGCDDNGRCEDETQPPSPRHTTK